MRPARTRGRSQHVKTTFKAILLDKNNIVFMWCSLPHSFRHIHTTFFTFQTSVPVPGYTVHTAFTVYARGTYCTVQYIIYAVLRWNFRIRQGGGVGDSSPLQSSTFRMNQRLESSAFLPSCKFQFCGCPSHMNLMCRRLLISSFLDNLKDYLRAVVHNTVNM